MVRNSLVQQLASLAVIAGHEIQVQFFFSSVTFCPNSRLVHMHESILYCRCSIKLCNPGVLRLKPTPRSNQALVLQQYNTPTSCRIAKVSSPVLVV
jgi:hypothetical protein